MQEAPSQPLGTVQVSAAVVVDPTEEVTPVGFTSPVLEVAGTEALVAEGQPGGIVQVSPSQSLGIVQVSEGEVVVETTAEVVEVI